MREKQKEPVHYILSLLSNLPLHHSKSATAYGCPGGLHGVQVARKASGIMVYVVVLPQPTSLTQLLALCPTTGMGEQIKRVKAGKLMV